MSHPTPRSSRGGRRHYGPRVPHPGTHIRQSHSFSSYPSSYYPPSPYAPPGSELSPIPVHFGAHPPRHGHYEGHHGVHDGRHGHPPHATPWPAPPPSSNTTHHAPGHGMDAEAKPPSPPAIAIAADLSTSPQSSAEEEAEGLAAASTLSTLANGGSPSAGPLKKRRKVAKKKENEMDVDAPQQSECRSPGAEDAPHLGKSSAAGQLPERLHELLSKTDDKDDKGGTSESAVIASALEWLPHGKGWRVLRWDVFCTEVLPKEFSGICDDYLSAKTDGNNVDTRDDLAKKEKSDFSDEQWVDAFLWHVRSWGFEEVLAGRDRGSFRHEFFVRESPERISQMNYDARRAGVAPVSTPVPSIDLCRTPSTDMAHSANWRKSSRVVSSIFKPRRTNLRDDHLKGTSPHPSHLHVPVLTSTDTASFAETWGNTEPRHLPPPPPTRSPRTIRFRDELMAEPEPRSRDGAVEVVTPNAEASPGSSQRKRFHSGFVSRRGRRPGIISRHATH